MNSKKITTDKNSITKEDKLYAFWKYDQPPYVLGGIVIKIREDGKVCIKGFAGSCFTPLQILPLEEGRAKQKEIDLALKNYKNTIKKAEEELRSHTKQLSRDDSVLDYNDLPDPADSAEVAAANLKEAVDLLMSVVKELRALEVQD